MNGPDHQLVEIVDHDFSDFSIKEKQNRSETIAIDHPEQKAATPRGCHRGNR
jgi:hypothetical protein